MRTVKLRGTRDPELLRLASQPNRILIARDRPAMPRHVRADHVTALQVTRPVVADKVDFERLPPVAWIGAPPTYSLSSARIVSIVSASSAFLSVRHLAMRGNRTAIPDLCRDDF